MQAFVHPNRLGQVAVKPGGQAGFDVARHGIGAQGQHRYVRGAGVGLQHVQGLHAADAGQIDVHQNQIWQVGACHGYAAHRVGCAQQPQVALARHQLHHQLQVGTVIFHIQQGVHGRVKWLRQGGLGTVLWAAGQPLGGGGQIKLKPKDATQPQRAVNPNLALHQFHQTAANHQPNAGALFAARFLPQPVERLKQLRQFLCRQPFTTVAHTHPHSPGGGALGADGGAAVGFVVLDGVGEQVDQHLFEPGAVGTDKAVRVNRFKLQRDPSLLRLRGHHGFTVLQHIVQRRGFE